MSHPASSYKFSPHLLKCTVEGREPHKDRCDCLIKRFIFCLNVQRQVAVLYKKRNMVMYTLHIRGQSRKKLEDLSDTAEESFKTQPLKKM